jgi:hypothetical protein
MHKLSQIFAPLFVQVAGSAPGRDFVKFLTIAPKQKRLFSNSRKCSLLKVFRKVNFFGVSLLVLLYHFYNPSNDKAYTQEYKWIKHRTEEQGKHFIPTAKGGSLDLDQQQRQPSIRQKPSKNNNCNQHN